jgi:hypothetical protein
LGISTNTIILGDIVSGSVKLILYIPYTTLAEAYAAAAYLNAQYIVFDPSLGNYIALATVKSPAASNICFPAGTPIQTDQGIFNIELLNPAIHTIQCEPILHITQTVTLNKYLICFEESSLKINIPTKKTIMSKDHKIEFGGQMVAAERFLNYSKAVKKVMYTGDVLYNVLLPAYSTINVNGLRCETLHLENRIAKLYMNNLLKNNLLKKVEPKPYF